MRPKPTPDQRRRMRRRPMIKAVLALKGQTITALAEEVGISREKMSRIINGFQANVDWRLEKKIADALGEKREYLFDEIPDNPTFN